MNDNPYQAPKQIKASENSKIVDPHPNLHGIKGWLVVLAMVLILAPIRLAVMMYQNFYLNFIADGLWRQLIDVNNDAYQPMMAYFVAGELLVNMLFFCAWLVVIVLFFGKKASFKKYFIVLMIASPIMLILDSLLILMLLDISMFDETSIKEIGQSMLAAVIWASYIQKSERVANTFVN